MKQLAAALALLAAPAYADPLTSTVTEDNVLTIAPTEWLGNVPHIVIMGTIDTYDFDIQMMDLQDDTIAEIAAKREYIPEGDMLHYADFEFGVKAVIEGMEKALELEFENNNFSDFDLPAQFILQSKEMPKGALSNMEFEFEWEGSGVSVNEEVAAWDGRLTLEMDTAAGSKEPAGDGLIGGYVTATKGDDQLIISFTVPVNEYEIDD